MSGLKIWQSTLCGLVLLSCTRLLAEGVLVFSILPREGSGLTAYKEVLRGFGETYGAAPEITRENDFQKALSGNPPRIIFAVGNEAATLASQRAPRIPLFFAMVRDPAVLQAQGATGITLEADIGTQLGYLKQLIPSLKSVGLFYVPASINPKLIEKAPEACKRAKISLFPVQIGSVDDISTALTLIGPFIQAFWLPEMPNRSQNINGDDWRKIGRWTRERNLPLVGPAPDVEFAKAAGMVLAFLPDFRGIGQRAGVLVQQLERGELKPTGPESPPVIPWWRDGRPPGQ